MNHHHHTNIKHAGQKPLVMQYMDSEETNSQISHLSDVSDVSDVSDLFSTSKSQNPRQTETETPDNQTPTQVQTKNVQTKITSDESDRCLPSDLEHVNHIDEDHSGKIYYPTQENFENLLKPNK